MLSHLSQVRRSFTREEPISSSSTSSSELWHFVLDRGHDVSSNCGIKLVFNTLFKLIQYKTWSLNNVGHLEFRFRG